ncbi:hypothetical protein [Phenylobacterium sp.]|jgi:hypothetical protein|nr:hypothetical protein [Phenylobacterium sp.]HEX4709899.1 hypothetical protein [Phenylobacterium sp.]
MRPLGGISIDWPNTPEALADLIAALHGPEDVIDRGMAATV